MENGPHFPLFSTPNFVKWNGRKFFRKNGHHFLQISLPKFAQWNGSLFFGKLGSISCSQFQKYVHNGTGSFFGQAGSIFLSFHFQKRCMMEWAQPNFFSEQRAAFPFSIPTILQSNGRIFAEKRAAFSLLSIPEMFTIKPFVLGGVGGIWAAFAPFLNSKTVYSQMGSIYLLEPKFVQSNGLNFSKIGQLFSRVQSQECVQWNEFFFFFGKMGRMFPVLNPKHLKIGMGKNIFEKKIGSISPCVQLHNSVLGTNFLGEKWPALSPPGLTCFGRSGSFSPVLHPKNVHSQMGSTFPGNGQHLPLLAIPRICAVKWAQNNFRKNGQHFPLYLTKNGQHFVLFDIQNCNTHLNPKVPT